MTTPRLVVSAAHKSSGKTTLSLGIARALCEAGTNVRTFKKGPDYIDPMWLARASGRPCFNLDFNTQTHAEIADMVARNGADGDICLIEGNKGLHDGVDTEGSDSSAALAKLLKAPAVLVIDALGMTRGVAPLLMGYAAFDTGVTIAGVILNRIGTPRQEGKLRAAIERYCDMPVLGAVGRNRAFEVAERHLGLTTPGEDATGGGKIEAAAAAVRAGVDLHALVSIAREKGIAPLATLPQSPARPQTLTIAVARDEAFSFYYPDDLDALERGGAKLVFFDALRDVRLPAADGLLIGGGFPEMHAAALHANASLRHDIAQRIAGGLPVYAECGGLMYLSRSIEIGGVVHDMVGALSGRAVFHRRPQGRGLARLTPLSAHPWGASFWSAGAAVPAHEFHYASLEDVDAGTRFAYEVARGHGVDGRRDGIAVGQVLANFCHLRDTSRCRWVEHFLAFVRRSKAAASAACAAG